MKVKFDNSHVWGEFHELIVDNTLIVRSIRVYENGASSLHKHGTKEILLVESGSVIEWLENDDGIIEKSIYSKGEIIIVPENKWHRLEYKSSDFTDNDLNNFAQVIEIMIGDNFNGNYEILRKESAVEGKNSRLDK